MNNKQILITGASGFVGPYLINSLQNKFPSSNITVTYLNNNDVERLKHFSINYIKADITIKENINILFSKILPDYIFHLAGQSSAKKSWDDPLHTFTINVFGIINILESLKDKKLRPRILVVGSSEQYGKISDNNPISEDVELNPSNPYGISKLTQEKICQMYNQAYQFDIIMTRSFNHIGPGQSPNFVISDWCMQIALIEMQKQIPEIKVGNLNVKRDFSNVEDVVDAYISIIQNGKTNNVYNVGSGLNKSLIDILNILISFSNIDISVSTDPSRLRPVDNPIILCDTTKLKKIYSKEFRPIEKSLLQILNYWRKKIEDQYNA